LDNWHFEPFVADIFGALSPSARRVVDKFTSSLFTKLAPEEALKAVADVWCAVSAATIFRAAFMLHRALESDSPIGIPLHKLDWPSNKRLRASY